jgi:hypothetical protein
MKRFTNYFAPFFILCLIPFTLSAQEQLTVNGWNAESGDANPTVISARLTEIDGCDIWGLCEVRDADWANQFEIAAEIDEGDNFDYVLGTTGGADRMQIIYNADRFELIDHFELHRINVGGRVRAPLVAHLRIQGTNIEFLFMVNHLYRSRADKRLEQAIMLNRWEAEQEFPIIAVGDYNFDWDVVLGESQHDPGYDAMVKDGVYTWVRPQTLMKT